MKLLITLLLFFALSHTEVAAKSDKDEVVPIEVLKEELKTGKSVLVYCYTTWCKPCLKMSKEVFPDKAVKEYMDSKYIFLKVDMESDEGLKFKEEFNITTYPTFLILRKGKLVTKFIGAYKSDAFISILKKNETKK